MTDWMAQAGRMARSLVDAGVLTDQRWRHLFATIPRHVFVPRFYELDGRNRPVRLVEPGTGDNGAGLALAYADQALVTRYHVAGTTRDGTEVRVPTSSASMPSVVSAMLDRLRVDQGNRVLEIGTGTGYNAALLSARVGEDNLTTVEIDPEAAAEAVARLAVVGFAPTVVVGDGALGWSARAPYQRIIATCAVDRIPLAWLEQLAPGGRLVAPLALGELAAGDALAVLDRDADGGLTGQIDPYPIRAGFMTIRSGQPGCPGRSPTRPSGLPYRGFTTVDPSVLDSPDLGLWLALHLPDARRVRAEPAAGRSVTTRLLAPGGWAEVPHRPVGSAAWPVSQYGSRRLWDTVESAYATYLRYGQPARDRLGITVQHDQQYVYLEQDAGVVGWPLPAG